MEDTVKKLSEITDTGLFEKLATAVLMCSTRIYESIIHTGVNEDGITIKDPFDGITFLKGANPPHMIAIHHTRTKLDGLKTKWLQDPDKVKQKSSTKSPPKKGDLIKTVKEYERYKKDMPNLKCTLVLTSNRHITKSKFIIEIQNEAQKYNIELDIWDASRIAHFLDIDPNGQYIRKIYLGKEEERLSSHLLKEISELSINSFPIFDNKKLWIERKLDEDLSNSTKTGLTMVVGESGQGKTVSCLKYLLKYIRKDDCYGIVVTPEEIEKAFSVEELIFNHISKINKGLNDGSGNDALSLSSLVNPFTILIEDVNRNKNSLRIIEKISAWDMNAIEGKSDKQNKQSWKILCPIWPQKLPNCEVLLKKLSIIYCTSFSLEEATEAIHRQYKLNSKKITNLKAIEISTAMGLDPLLIGLFRVGDDKNPSLIIKKFILNKLDVLSQEKEEFTAAEYFSSLKDLIMNIYINHIYDPTWNDIEGFNFDSNKKKMLNDISTQGQIYKLIGNAEVLRFEFRHDRVQDWLASYVIAERFNNKIVNDLILTEPFFSRIIGLALNESNIKSDNIKKIRNLNPLSLFYSLKDFEDAKTENQNTIVLSIIDWLKDVNTQTKSKTSTRLECLRILSQTDSKHVSGILSHFHDKKNWNYPIAGFRNGCMNLGIELCSRFEPGINFSSHELLIQHVISKYKEKYISELKSYLTNTNTDDIHLSGALRICGYIASTELLDSLKELWNNLTRKRCKILLKDYFWACAQCCGDEPDILLKPIFDIWSSLSSKEMKNGLGSERDKFASDTIKWAFEKYIPKNAIEYFISKTRRKNLTWPLTYMLHNLDHPDAVVYIAHYLSEIRKKIQGTQQYHSFLTVPQRGWERKQEVGNAMSWDSRKKLYELWTNKKNDKHLRKESFLLWAATITNDDKKILRKYEKDRILKDNILKARLKRGDLTVIKQLISKIKNDNFWWWEARTVWSDELSEALDVELNKLSKKIFANKKYQLSDVESVLIELVMRLPFVFGEKLLVKHWKGLKYNVGFVQLALYLASDKTVKLASIEVNKHHNPKDVFRYITLRYGIFTLNHPGVTRVKQLEVLVPFLQYFDPFYVYEFWDLCNKNKWFDFRKENLDPLIKGSQYDASSYISKENVFESLNKKAKENQLRILGDWINNYIKTGVSAEEIIRIVFEWVKLQDKTNFKILHLALNVVWSIGTREDYIELRDVIYKDINIFNEEFEDWHFAIRRRTLK